MDSSLILSESISAVLHIVGYYNPNRFFPSLVHPVATDGELFYAFYPDGRYTRMTSLDVSKIPQARFIKEESKAAIFSKSRVYLAWSNENVRSETLTSTINTCKIFLIRSASSASQRAIVQAYLKNFLALQQQKADQPDPPKYRSYSKRSGNALALAVHEPATDYKKSKSVSASSKKSTAKVVARASVKKKTIAATKRSAKKR